MVKPQIPDQVAVNRLIDREKRKVLSGDLWSLLELRRAVYRQPELAACYESLGEANDDAEDGEPV